MIKILYIVSTLKNTGPTNQLYNIIKYSDKNIFHQQILTLSSEPKDSKLSDFKDLGINIDSLNFTRIESFLKGKKKLLKYIESIKPDIIHTQGIRADILSSKLLSSYLTISTIRNYPFDDYPLKFGKIRGNIMARKHLDALKGIDFTIACSKSIHDILKEKHGIQLDYIQNGVNTEKFYAPTKNEKIEIRKKLGIPIDCRMFVSVGSLIHRKDPITVVKGFLESELDDNSKLFLIGDGPLKFQIQDMFSSNKIVLIGQVNNVSEYLKAADYFLSLSLSEGLPNTVLEAMATGIPSCLSDIPSHREILNYNNKAGLLTKIKDYRQLSLKIKQLVKEDYKEMSEAAKSIIENHLSAKRMSEKYQKYYKDIMNDTIKS